jgi:hypothetical protein
VFTDSEAEVAYTLVNKLADSMASKSADVANKSMEMAQSNQTELRVSTLPGNHNGQTFSVPTIDDMSENRIFQAGVPACCQRLHLHLSQIFLQRLESVRLSQSRMYKT